MELKVSWGLWIKFSGYWIDVTTCKSTWNVILRKKICLHRVMWIKMSYSVHCSLKFPLSCGGGGWGVRLPVVGWTSWTGSEHLRAVFRVGRKFRIVGEQSSEARNSEEVDSDFDSPNCKTITVRSYQKEIQQYKWTKLDHTFLAITF